MSEITRFDVYGRVNYSNDGSLVLYDHHKEIISDLERQLKEANKTIENLKNIERQRWESASKALGIKPLSDRGRKTKKEKGE